MIFCKCGCKKEVKDGNIFIKGHNTRIKNPAKEIDARKKISEAMRSEFPPIFDLCHCGCKEIVWNRRKYIWGHNNNGKICSNETKLKISKANNGIKRSKECKEKMKINKKGMLGLYHSKETKNKMSKSAKGRIPSPKAGYGKGGYYESPLQGRIYLRSSYELKYAEYLDDNKILWMYEIETFDLGDTTYTPDFFLIKDDKFIEVKGYMTEKYQEKINKFKEEYPFDLDILYKEDLIVLGIEI